MSIYKVGKCNYCDSRNVVLRPSPFIADGAMMCEECWEMTKKEYANSNGEYIPKFDEDKEDYEMAKDNIKPYVDITINQAPVSVTFECPFCHEKVEIDYDDFEDIMASEYWDWEGSKFECPKCEREIRVDNIDWD